MTVPTQDVRVPFFPTLGMAHLPWFRAQLLLQLTCDPGPLLSLPSS